MIRNLGGSQSCCVLGRDCTEVRRYLCLEEKLMIMKGRSKNILNRRSEIFTKCRHVI